MTSDSDIARKSGDSDDLAARIQSPSTCRKAFEEVIARYSEPLHWQIRRMAQNHDDAADSLTFLDRQKRRNSVDIDDPDSHLAAAIESDTNIDGDKLSLEFRKAIATLPEKQRLVFNMRYFDEMPYEQISNILGTSQGALKASYHLAVKKIEKYFQNID